MMEMDVSDNLNADLIDFEAQIANEIDKIAPDIIFVNDLRDRLLNSRVFVYRRSIGAIVVASLSVLLMGTLSYIVVKLLRKAKRAVLR
ncbi:MAG: hypothetical protein ACOYKC_00730 [Anaerolineaceae bacterium]